MAKAKKKAKKTKKTTKKAAKKPKAKRKVYVKIRSQVLGEAPQEHEFCLSDGRRLKSVYELIDALESMSDEIFREHVNEAKNDFSSWINDVFKAPDIAKEIKKIQDRIETQKALMKRLIEAAKKAA